MKQLDFETSNYKHKEDIKTFVVTFNDMVDKYVKTFENRAADLKKVNSCIEKKNTALNKLEVSLLDLNKKTDELKALKEMSSGEIKELDAKKGTIAYTDSEVQKMELDDINAQIVAKKGKISKIDAKLDATKTKIKASSDEKKVCEKELKDLDKKRVAEEEALYKTEEILALIGETKEKLNKRVIDIINAPYHTNEELNKKEEFMENITAQEVVNLDAVLEDENVVVDEEEDAGAEEAGNAGEVIIPDLDEEVSVLDLTEEPEFKEPTMEIPPIDEEELDAPLDLNVEEESVTVQEEVKEEKEKSDYDSLLEDMFKKESLSLNDFATNARREMLANQDAVIRNMGILKKHNVPLEYTVDQSEIYYDISSQDLDDLLSIITTDDEGNGMGFTIDFAYNILSELSKINVDKLIDVYNSEFMNVNAKSGIIHLLKLTNPSLKDFEKNRRTNIEILKSLGANTVDEIVSKHPEFVNMDNPLFINVLNVFDKKDLVEKLNADVDVIPKIVEYWKNN